MKTVKLCLFYILVLIALSRCNTKSHYVDISGKVIDVETGAPVEGVKVIADSYYSKDIQNDQEAYTNSNGEVEFPHFKMAYPRISLKNQKSSRIALIVSSNDYMQQNEIAFTLGKQTTKFFTNLYVNCLTKGNFYLAINSSYVYDYGVITGESCRKDNSGCIGIASGSSSGIYSFTPSSIGSFNAFPIAGNLYNNILTTRLYNSNVLIKTQVDTITGLTCKSNFNYTITVN